MQMWQMLLAQSYDAATRSWYSLLEISGNKQAGEYVFRWYVERRLLNKSLSHSLLGIHCTLVADFTGIHIPSATPFSVPHAPSILFLAVYYTVITMISDDGLSMTSLI